MYARCIGLTLFVGRLSNFIASWVYAPLYDLHDNLFLPLFIGDIVCIFTFCLAILLVILD